MGSSMRFLFLGVFLFVSMQHFFIGMFSKNKKVNFAFGIVSLVMAMSSYSIIHMLKATNIENYLFWFNAIWICPSIGGVFQILFVSYYTKIIYKPLLIFNILISIVTISLIFILPNGSIFSQITSFDIKNNNFGEPQAYIEGHLSWLSTISYLYVTIIFLYIFIVLTKFYNNKQNRKIAVVFIVAFAIRALLVINDMIADVLPFSVYLLEYGNIVLIVIMSIILSFDIAKVDILEEKMKQEHEMTRFKAELTQMMVHDLKNPLTNIIASSHYPSVYHQQVKQSGTTMLNLITNILDVSRFENEKLVLQKNDISIQELFEIAKTQVEYNLKAKFITINELIAENFILHVDVDLTVRIFVNLLTNSIKYSKPGSLIVIKAFKENNYFVRIEVNDQGKGIPQERLFHLFDNYQQADKSFSYSTGVGLTFCKLAVEAHGGNIRASSQEEEWTSIQFTLPLGDKDYNYRPSSIKQNIAIQLDRFEKEKLSSFYPLLSELDVNEISAFKRIITAIEKDNIANEAWMERLKNSVYYCDQELFHEMVELIKQ